jgi:hypothetical protein
MNESAKHARAETWASGVLNRTLRLERKKSKKLWPLAAGTSWRGCRRVLGDALQGSMLVRYLCNLVMTPVGALRWV